MINICNNTFLIDIVFWTEALDSISIVDYTDGMFLRQVLLTFSWGIVIRGPACRFRLIDIHEMSHPSVVRTPRTNRDWRSPLCRHHNRIPWRALRRYIMVFKKWFDLSEVCGTNELQFVSSWFVLISIKMGRIEKEQFLRKLTHLTLDIVEQGRRQSSRQPDFIRTRYFSPSISFRTLRMSGVIFAWFPLLKNLKISYTFPSLELRHPQEYQK